MPSVPEAAQAPSRRRCFKAAFKAAFKARILADRERLGGRGVASALLRREGLYWSRVAKWRQQRETDELEDSWTEPWVRSRIQTLIDERAELMREIETLAEQNRSLRERLGLAQDRGDHEGATGFSAE